MDIASSRRRGIAGSKVNDSDYFPFGGGLNLVDTPLKIRPGQLLASKNYEPGIRGGYNSVPGYERYDGRLEPSQARYWLVSYTAATQLALVGSTLTGVTSAANGIVLAVVESKPVSTLNHARQSEAFDVAPWSAVNASVIANVEVSPLTGEQNADRLIEDTADGRHEAVESVPKASVATMYWYSCYVRSAGRVRGRLQVSTSDTQRAFVNFDLLNRALDNAQSEGAFAAHTQWMIDAGGGWWRVGLKFTSDAQGTIDLAVRLRDSAGAPSYVGDGVRGLALFGAQLEETTAETLRPSPYVPAGPITGGDGEGYYVLARLSGEFQSGESLSSVATVIGRSEGGSRLEDAATDELQNAYRQLAIDDARAQINAPPGSGRVLGAVVYRGVVYAVRNNADSSAAHIYRSSLLGWSQVQLGFKLRFDAGSVAIAEGATITGVTSSANAVVRRIVVQSGTWGAGTAAGYIVLQVIVGTFADNELLAVNAVNSATVNGAAQAQALAPGGAFEFRVHNFYGHTGRLRLYGCDGVNAAFEYQDSPEFFAQIETGMQVDRPNHIGVHQSQLWLMFPGGSVQKSGVGDPLVWQVSLGAAELGIGDEGTGFLEEIGDTLFVFARNSSHYVFGTPAAYSMKPYNAEVGAFAGSIQRIGKGLYLDDRGFSTLGATQSYGNFAYNSISALIQPLIKQLKHKVTCSITVKDDNLYRLFFDDGRFISVGVHNKDISGFTACEYPVIVRCAFAGEDLLGEQMIVMGGDDGMVYRAQRGTSFDGATIETFLRPVYFFSRTPSRRKRYRRAQFDVRAVSDLSLDIAVDYSFGDADDPSEAVRTVQLGGGGGLWGQAIWGQFKWGSGSAPECIVKLEGSGINIGFLIASNSSTAAPHSIEGVALHHSQRRINRGVSYA